MYPFMRILNGEKTAVEAIHALIERGADVNASMPRGGTPLRLARQWKRVWQPART